METLYSRAFRENFLPVTINDILRWRAEHQPDQTAFTLLSERDNTVAQTISYSELDHRATIIASFLLSKHTPGQRALLLFPSGIDYISAFFGCLYAGIVAVPLYPPRLNRSLQRLNSIIADATPTLALTSSGLFPKIKSILPDSSSLSSLDWYTTDTITDHTKESSNLTVINDETIAFLQYTSGSTSTPKGVILSHENLMHNQRLIERAFDQSTGSTIVSWLPLFHDMGLIGNVLQPIYTGSHCVLMSPTSFLISPWRWLDAISKYRAATSGGPNFAYDLCVRKIKPEHCSDLDLSSWRVAFNGSEPIRHETLERFTQMFGPYGFRAEAFTTCYGLAESTLLVSASHIGERPKCKLVDAKELSKNLICEPAQEIMSKEVRAIVSSGSILEDPEIEIVNPTTMRRCSANQIGEIWLRSKSVGHGYWGQAAETERIFRAEIEGEKERSYLRTGDMGFISDGELYVTGRYKDLIIVRGVNYYPQDIEASIDGYIEELRGKIGAAFSVEIEDKERVVVVQEIDRKGNIEERELIQRIRELVLEEHDIEVHAVILVKAGTIPRTSSGKIQRHACRENYLSGQLEIVEEWHVPSRPVFEELSKLEDLATPSLPTILDIENFLSMAISSKIGMPQGAIDISYPITRYGIDSLATIELIHMIEARFGVSIPFSLILECPSITILAEEIHTELNGSVPTKIVASSTNEFEASLLSYNQRSLWFLHQLDPQNTAYNIANAVRIRSKLNILSLREAFHKLIDRHPSLRTSFNSSKGYPTQEIHKAIDFDIHTENISAWSEEELKAFLIGEANKPFDLLIAPLFRVYLLTRSDEEHILLLVVHHIVSDLWSLDILVKELTEFYEAEVNSGNTILTPLITRYTDYVRYQSNMLESEGDSLLVYWKNQLSGELPVLNLPFDRPRPPVQTNKGGSEQFKVSKDISRKIRTISNENGTTLYMSLLAAFELLLYRYTGQEDILIGTPTAGRNRPEFAHLIGYFVNPIAIRENLSGNPTFKELLNRVRQTVIEGFKHQDYPFSLLVEKLQPERDASRSPIFQVMFALQKSHLSNTESLTSFALGKEDVSMKLGTLQFEPIALAEQVSQFDLTVTMAEVDEELIGTFTYNTDLFDAETISRLITHFKLVLEQIALNVDQHISKISLLTEEEKHQQLVIWNSSHQEYTKYGYVHHLFEEQVKRTPDSVAVIYEGEELLYDELNRRANQVAHYLGRLGIVPGMLVGICMERSLNMIISLLGILKAGGSYVPLDPTYPKDRLAYMLQNVNMQALLTQESLATGLPEMINTVRVDGQWEEIAQENEQNPDLKLIGNDLIYVIFTSGSTGLPKAAAVYHSGFANLLHWFTNEFNINSRDTLLIISSLSFDLTQKNIFAPLITGGRLCLATSDYYDPKLILETIEENSVTLLNCTPSSFYPLIEHDEDAVKQLRSLRLLSLGGEPISTKRLLKWIEDPSFNSEIVNHYGPTECSDVSTYYRLNQHDYSQLRTPPIGRPIYNSKIFILDKNQQLLPIGATGEICITGNGLGAGYLNDEQLTKEKFIYGTEGELSGVRIYKTGDLGRYLRDGNIEFLGRIDHQVKIHGFRIELGEIESMLNSYPDIRESVVTVREDRPEEKWLVAYIVTLPHVSPSNTELRYYLQQKLPDYMVPQAFIAIESLPLTPSGKVDRKALPIPDWSTLSLDLNYVAPRTPIEERLVEIWKEVLGIDRVGINDNFFELGGHSLLMTQIVSRVRDEFGVELSMKNFFQFPYIANLAPIITHSKALEHNTIDINSLLDQLENISEDELETLIQKQ
jgi:amino acid adenylation domain-containing protein